MNRSKLVPAAGIAVVLLVWLLWGLHSLKENKRTRVELQPALPVITSETQPMTVDEIHLRLQRTLNATMPGHYLLDVDKDAGTITIDQWTDGLGASFPNAALHYKEYLLKWRSTLEDMRQANEQAQQLINDHGHPELSLIWRLVNDDDRGQIFAVVERGKLVYDVVADTPPGEEVPDPTSRVQPTETATAYADYVINTASGIFHRASCSAAEQIASYNREDFHGDRHDLILRGLAPCGLCNP